VPGKGSICGHQPVSVRLARAPVVPPIPGPPSVVHPEGDKGAAGLVQRISREDVAALTAAV
jgi:hypothetical protein